MKIRVIFIILLCNVISKINYDKVRKKYVQTSLVKARNWFWQFIMIIILKMWLH